MSAFENATLKNYRLESIGSFAKLAMRDPAAMQELIAEYQADYPDQVVALAELFKAAGNETLCKAVTPSINSARYPLVIGQPVTDQGVPFSKLTAENGKIIQLNIIDDLLRDASGEIVKLTGNQAIDAITTFNGGVKYGNGYEKANTSAVARRKFKDGTIILASLQDLLKIANERENNPALKQINAIIASSSLYDSVCVSSTENSDRSSHVYPVGLKVGYLGWYTKGKGRSRVVALRGFNCG